MKAIQLWNDRLYQNLMPQINDFEGFLALQAEIFGPAGHPTRFSSFLYISTMGLNQILFKTVENKGKPNSESQKFPISRSVKNKRKVPRNPPDGILRPS